jgi:hypothetical protein
LHFSGVTLATRSFVWPTSAQLQLLALPTGARHATRGVCESQQRPSPRLSPAIARGRVVHVGRVGGHQQKVRDEGHLEGRRRRALLAACVGASSCLVSGLAPPTTEAANMKRGSGIKSTMATEVVEERADPRLLKERVREYTNVLYLRRRRRWRWWRCGVKDHGSISTSPARLTSTSTYAL